MSLNKVNPALDTLMFGVYIEALESGTEAERHVIRTAINSVSVPQHESVWSYTPEEFRGFDVGPYDHLCVKFAEMRLTRTFFKAIRRELIENIPQIYLNESGQLELPNDVTDDDVTPDGYDTALVKILKTNYGLYHSLTFVFSNKEDLQPFFAVKVNINTDVYTSLLN